MNFSSQNIAATDNYWGLMNSSSISQKIYDATDNINYGEVNFSSFKTTLSTQAPIMAPINLTKKDTITGVLLTWSNNQEADVAGYKIYYGNFDGYRFSNFIDVGRKTSYFLSGQSSADLILVTAYDNFKDGINDLYEGHESWYSKDVLPVAEILNGNSAKICQGQRIVLKAKQSGSYKYQWLKNGEVIENATADSLAVYSSGRYQVKVTNKSNNTVTSDEFILATHQLTIQNSTFPVVCGGIVELSPYIFYNGNDSLVYSWDADSTLSALDIPNPVVSINSSRTYKINVTDHICSSQGSVNVIVEPLIVSADNMAVTCGNSINLSVTSNYSGSGDLAYTWSPANGLSGTDIPNPVVTVKGSITYSVLVKTPDGCSSTAYAEINSTAIEAIPSICMVSVNGNDKNVVIWEQSYNTAIDSLYVYRESNQQTDQYDLTAKMPYSGGGKFIDNSSNARVQYNKYTIAFKDVCGNLTIRSSAHKTMHLSINKGIGTSWNLIWEPYVGQFVSSYKIYRGTGTNDLSVIGSVSGSNTSFTDETAPEGVLYYVIEVISESCNFMKSTDFAYSRSNIVSTSGISGNSDHSFIYPNPAFDQLNVEYQFSDAILSIYDLEGRLLMSRQVDSNPVEITFLSRGIYTVKLVDGGNVKVTKLVKNK
jgi:hypothetical protein